ncbi:MAG: class I SAM-dependent methyltransferase [Gemmatimonadota bacterium]
MSRRIRELGRSLEAAVQEAAEETPYYGRAYPRYQETIQVVAPLLERARSVVEIGPSPLAQALARCGWNTAVLGLYRSNAERERLAAAGVEVMDWDLLAAESPPVNRAFDVVLFLEVIEHLPVYPARVLRRLRPLVEEGGSLIVSTPDLHRLSNRLKMLARRPIFGPFVETPDCQYHVREYCRRELEDYLRLANYTPVESGHMGPFHTEPISGALRRLRPLTKLFTTHLYVVAVS